jgi:hypothetical protein
MNLIVALRNFANSSETVHCISPFTEDTTRYKVNEHTMEITEWTIISLTPQSFTIGNQSTIFTGTINKRYILLWISKLPLVVYIFVFGSNILKKEDSYRLFNVRHHTTVKERNSSIKL